ncbi:murein L,D-transpeptidase catalytic domain-containing protein [Bdellovibrio sp. HCB2-146]|uniref:murein L,D-transpeptidase catalytic domain-containing protein n=1 Tax=Bdellovibrio sp. HCB2-146 TaxID=3394362 RepID=UPI0039BCE4B2
MKKIASILILVTGIICGGLSAHADSLFDRRLNTGQLLYEALLEKGVARPALDLLFRMFDYNEGRIPNVDYAVIVDYTMRSTEKRLFLLNFISGQVDRYYVAHGIRSGVVEARNFSNLQDSWKSSLGFYYAKGTYTSPKNGLSLYLEGIDRSNNAAKDRQIVIHGAKYVSDEFILKNKRLGWSEGCFAVALEVAPYLISTLQTGSLILSYHRDLMGYARQYPWEQSLLGEELVPRDVNRNRTPGEGGGTD